MLDIPNFIYHQQPIFWCLLGGTFFLLGLLYASVAWRSWKRRLQRAERAQESLMAERKKAIADRQHRWQGEACQLIRQESADPATQLLVPMSPNIRRQLPPDELPPKQPTPAHSKRTADESELARARAIAGLFSASYDSGPAAQRNGTNGQNGDGQSPTRTTNNRIVRPNPWTNYQ